MMSSLDDDFLCQVYASREPNARTLPHFLYEILEHRDSRCSSDCLWVHCEIEVWHLGFVKRGELLHPTVENFAGRSSIHFKWSPVVP